MRPTRWLIQSLSIIFLFILIPYSNTFIADWHLDDLPNIVQNEYLHLTKPDNNSIIKVLSAHPREEGRLFRPIVYLTFALNWYFGSYNVVGYHIINIFFHIGTAFLLYLTVFLLLDTPALQGHQRPTPSKHLIALLSTLPWALNPIQTQAVTYIVQRMAVLATFFSLASIFCYFLGRRSQKKYARWVWFLAALICFILALGSKENSITLPVVLLLVEWIFFHSLGRITVRHLLAGIGIGLVAGLAVFLLTNGDPIESIINYDHRNFTLWQRLLTESRIMIFYLSLLFFPAPWRLSLDHDFALSTSLLQPPTTLLSILFLIGLTAWACWKHKSLPIPAFAILFFLLNHTIESTIFPLELIFEHRNYLPSLFLFFPVAVMLVDASSSDRLRTIPIARYAISGGTVLVLCMLAYATYTRNAVWQTEQSLWEDSLAKAPGQSRPYINLAYTYQKLGRNDEAFELCRQSLTKVSATPVKDRMRAYNNMGNIAMGRGAYTEAITYYRQASAAFANESSQYFLHKALLAADQPEEAQKELTALIQNHPNDQELKVSMALVLAARYEFQQAITMLRSVLDSSQSNRYERSSAFLCLGSLLSRQGDYQEAEEQFRAALPMGDPLLPLLCIIGNHLRQDNQAAAIAQLRELQKHYSSDRLLSPVREAHLQNILFPVTPSKLAAFVQNNPVPAPAPDSSTVL